MSTHTDEATMPLNTSEQPDDPLPSPNDFNANAPSTSTSPTPKSSGQWLTWAIGSGAFAAFNGVFAKLTTTTQTNTLSSSIASFLHLSSHATLVSYLIRGLFFALNLICNAIMWILFTRALTLASSTTRVSILNTSANFMVTAVLGMLVFGELLPTMWWIGAGFLCAGSVVIGMREEKSTGSGQVVDDFGEESDAGAAASVALGTGGVGGAAAIEGYRDRDSVESGNHGLELRQDGYRDEDGGGKVI